MSKVHSIADPSYVNRQYRDASHLNARIRLHQQFSTNQYGWQRWLFDQFKLTSPSRILELGCGPGDLWLENSDRIPAGSEVILSDLSPGMVAQARHNLREGHFPFQFMHIDAQSIPFAESSFDLVIASHMLYHVPDRARALSEIRRLLKPAGCFFASTIGHDHLKELKDLVARFDPQLNAWGSLPADSFTLENGAAQLEACFAEVALHRYPDALLVTDASLLSDYIASGRLELTPGQRKDLAAFVEQALAASAGRLKITKDSGLFEARNTRQP